MAPMRFAGDICKGMIAANGITNMSISATRPSTARGKEIVVANVDHVKYSCGLIVAIVHMAIIPLDKNTKPIPTQEVICAQRIRPKSSRYSRKNVVLRAKRFQGHMTRIA
jgi:hypothetical protein